MKHTSRPDDGGKRVIGIILTSIFLILPLVFLTGGFISGVRKCAYHEAHKSQLVSIPAIVSKYKMESDDVGTDRYLYITYQYLGKTNKDVRWKIDNDVVHKVGDTVTIQVYPNGEMVSRNLGLPMVAAVLMAVIMGAVLLIFMERGPKGGRITYAVTLRSLHKKRAFAVISPGIIYAGAGLILVYFLMHLGVATFCWGVGILALGVFLMWVSIKKTLKKAEGCHRWAVHVCSGCVDRGDSETTDWQSTFVGLPDEYGLGKLQPQIKYWLLFNEKNIPELAFEYGVHSVDKEDTQDGASEFVKSVWSRLLLVLAIYLLWIAVSYFVGAKTSFLSI